MLSIWGPFHKKILRLRYTLKTSSSSWRNTTSAIVSQQTIVTTTSSHYQSLVMFENTRNHKIMLFAKHIFASDLCLRLRSLLRFFVKRGLACRLLGEGVISLRGQIVTHKWVVLTSNVALKIHEYQYVSIICQHYDINVKHPLKGPLPVLVHLGNMTGCKGHAFKSLI